MADESPAYDAFLSHSKKDRLIVEEIRDRLQSMAPSLKVWFDEISLRAGDTIPKEVASGLERSSCIVVFFGKELGKFQEIEVNYAIQEQKRIVSVELPGSAGVSNPLLRQKLTLGLGENWQEDGSLQRLLEGIGVQAGDPPPARLGTLGPRIRDLERKVLEGAESREGETRLVETFSRELNRIFNAEGQGYFLIDEACEALRRLEITRREWWEEVDDECNRRGRALMRAIFGCFAGLIKKRDDFVLFWYVQPVLAKFSLAKMQTCLDILDDWRKSNDSNLLRLFALEILSSLASYHPDRILSDLVTIANDGTYRSTFWLSRALLLSIRRLPVRGYGWPDSRKKDRALQDLMDAIEEIARDPTFPTEIRSLALANLPGLALRANKLPEVERTLVELANDSSLRWGFFDLVISLRDWDSSLGALAWRFEVMLWIMAGCPSVQGIRPYLAHAISAAVSHDVSIFRTSRSLQGQRPAQITEQQFQARERSEREAERRGPSPVVVFHPTFIQDTTRGHFESRERIQFAHDWLRFLDHGQLRWIESTRRAKQVDLKRAHHEKTDRRPEGIGGERGREATPKIWRGYVDEVKEAWEELRRDPKGEGRSTLPVRVDMYEMALYSAGAVLVCVDKVSRERAGKASDPAAPGGAPNPGAGSAWALNRPPGHLANNAICLFNNVAVAALYARERHGYQRILILDFDAHCGVHTSRCFRHQEGVVYFSFHDQGSYSDSVFYEPSDSPPSFFHVPYDETLVGDIGYQRLVNELLVPFMESYSPDLVLLSAGFDGHIQDPLNNGRLTEVSYGRLAEVVADYCHARAVPVVGTIEGGYGLRALARSLSTFISIVGRCDFDEETILAGPPHLRLAAESEPEKKVPTRQEQEEHAFEVILQAKKSEIGRRYL